MRTLALVLLAFLGVGRPQLLPRQTASSTTPTSPASSPSTTPQTTSSQSISNNCPDQGNASPCYICDGVFGDTIGLNSWYSSSYDLTVATVVHSFIQYDNTLVQVNSTRTITVANATDIYTEWASIAGGIAPTLTGVPTTMAIGDGGSTDYAASIIAPGDVVNLDNQTQIMSPSAWLAGPGIMFVGYTIISAGETSTTTLFNQELDITVFAPTEVPATGWSGTEQFAMPSAMKTSILQADVTLDGFPLSLCSNVDWSMGGEPTVHVPVNTMTVTSSTTSTSSVSLVNPTASSSDTPVTTSSSDTSEPTSSAVTKDPATGLLPTAPTLTLSTATTTPVTKSAAAADTAESQVLGSSTTTKQSSASDANSNEPATTLISTNAVGEQTTIITSAPASTSQQSQDGIGSNRPVTEAATAPAVLTAGSLTITQNLASQSGDDQTTAAPDYIVSGTTLLAGSAVTIAQTTISVASDGSAVVVNGQTLSTSVGGGLTLGNSVAAVTATLVSGTTAFIVDGQTLVTGSKVVVAGQTLSIASGESGIVVASGSSTSVEGLGGAIMSGLGVTSPASVGASSSGAQTKAPSSGSASSASGTTNSAGPQRHVIGYSVVIGIFMALTA